MHRLQVTPRAVNRVVSMTGVLSLQRAARHRTGQREIQRVDTVRMAPEAVPARGRGARAPATPAGGGRALSRGASGHDD